MQKGELAGILDGLSIQVDNPLVILTQETSKNFLRGEVSVSPRKASCWLYLLGIW